MIKLYGAGEGFGLPEYSPYACKTEVQLQMAGLAYVKDRAPPHLSPKGQLPFIDDNGKIVADSTFIRVHIEETYGVDLDAGLSNAQRGQAWAVERMIENHFGWVSAWTRFMIPENYEKGPARWFDHLPADQAEQMRAVVMDKVQANLMSVGIGRHTPNEILAMGDWSLQSLSAILECKPYLMGDRPAGVDAVAFAMLAGLMTPFFDSPLRRRAERYGNLVAYVDRMMARCYPDHPWGELQIAA